jgi:hypothetical protein
MIVLAVVLCCTSTIFVLAQNEKSEARDHPRIEKAIHQLEDAIAYMEKAPHDFGGHKAEAIRDSKKAIESLKLALEYRAIKDKEHKK